MDKHEELHKNYKALHELKDEMDRDETLPLKEGATQLVFGVGNTETKILLVGEGPGFNEDKQGEPFVGQAGKLLNKLLEVAGLERRKVFITNVVHHRPPNNRDPLPEEIDAYGKYLDRIIEIIKPKVIITLGRFSMAKFLPGVFISGVHGKKYDVKWKGQEIKVVPMYHPAASLRNRSILEQEKKDFYELKKMLPEILSTKDDTVKEEKERVKQTNLI